MGNEAGRQESKFKQGNNDGMGGSAIRACIRTSSGRKLSGVTVLSQQLHFECCRIILSIHFSTYVCEVIKTKHVPLDLISDVGVSTLLT